MLLFRLAIFVLMAYTHKKSIGFDMRIRSLDMSVKSIHWRFFVVVMACFGAVALCACGSDRRLSFSGRTMGTTYHITVVAPAITSAARLQKKVDARLAEINNSMSTYIRASEINRFNAFEHVGRPFAASDDFVNVLKTGKKIFDLTGGAWDATVWPLVKLWGFHLPVAERQVPTAKQVAGALTCVGFDKVRLTEAGVLKKEACVTLDMGSIAKGYGVDQIAVLLKETGINDFIVEIGGEIVASGAKENGAQWNIGINLPEAYAPADRVRRTLPLSNRAVATSGDYRNFFVVGNQRYCHVLDPRSGYPVKTSVVSASVVSDSCAFADGLATALMILPPEESLNIVNALADTECLITVREATGQLKDYYSKSFSK